MKKALFLFLLILINSCSKEDSCEPNPTLSTNEVSNITDSSASISGNINPPTCDTTVTSQGFVYGTSNLPTVNNSKVVKSGTTISATLTNLEQNKTYYYRTFFENLTGVYYGNEVSFSTSIGDVTFLNSSYSNVTPFSAVISFGINETGGGTISEQGIVYSLNSNPTINDTKIEVSGSSINIEGLQPDTLYYIRPFGVNESGLFYGEEISFKTSDGIVEFDVLFSKIKMDGFEYDFEITDDGGYGDLITDKGIYFSNSNNSSNINITPSSNGLVTGLNADTAYFSFPYYEVNGEIEYILEAIEVKTAPENIMSEVRRAEPGLDSPFQNINNKGYGSTGIDADVFIDTDMKYIKEARLEILQFYIEYGTNEERFSIWGGWIMKNDTYDYSESYPNKTETSSDGTLLKQIGIGGRRNTSLYINTDYRLRVTIEDYSGNLHYSDYFQLNIPDF